MLSSCVRRATILCVSKTVSPMSLLTVHHQILSLTTASCLRGSLNDTHGRFHNYLRISLSERCNLRCQYCMPEEGVTLSPADQILTHSEIYQLAAMFVSNGVTKIRLTGGEPLVRKDILEIVESLSTLRPAGLKLIGMTTNGVTLSRKAAHLRQAGLDLINVSLDTLKPEKFTFITRRNGLQHVLKAIHAALAADYISVKINCVVMRGLNDDEILDFVAFTKTHCLSVRFIEYMPFDGNRWSSKKFFSFLEMMKVIKDKYPDLMKLKDDPNDASKSYQVPGYLGSIGFITSMSNLFCSGCNRIRLTAEGNIKVCLFDNREVSLRDALRAGASDSELLQIVSDALSHKKKEHSGAEVIKNSTNRPMILIGG